MLDKYSANSLVFHTGDFGGFPLATELNSWHDQQHAVDILEINDFQQHYQAIDIKNWIVVGAHWQRCTHDKPLGFINLLKIKHQDPDFRVFSLPQCTAKFMLDDCQNDNIDNPITTTCKDQDYYDDSLSWHQQADCFELVCQ